MPGQVIYGEDHPGLRWQMVAIATLGWVAFIGGGAAMVVNGGAPGVPPLLGFGVPAAIIGCLIGAFYSMALAISRAVGLRVYEDSIQIGGLHGRDRSLQRGTWPPPTLNVSMRRKAVFICPWQATDGLYLLTERSEIKRFRQDATRYTRSVRGKKIPLGVFSGATAFADAILVISNDPRRTESEPREFDVQRGQYGLIYPVRSSAWMVPIRNPAAFRAAVQRLPQAPPVYDFLPEGRLRFEVS